MSAKHTVTNPQSVVHPPCLICSEKQASPIINYPEMSAANEVTSMAPAGKQFLCIGPETFHRRCSSQSFDTAGGNIEGQAVLFSASNN